MTDEYIYQKRIVCAANRNKDGVIILGVRHWDSNMRNHAKLVCGEYIHGSEWEQGFIDQHSTFYTREEAWIIAFKAGQVIRRCGSDDINGGHLFSENLY